MAVPILALGAMILYLMLLAGIAHYADRQRDQGRSIVSNPYVYALSLCVYCTAWTFYGSIGRAASTGLGFLPIYLGPTFGMILGWLMIRKITRISKEFRLTSISDFISFRYGRSYAIGAMVTVFSLMVITPYVALQLNAISSSIQILGGESDIWMGTKFLVAALLAMFCIIFGARHLDPLERHEGLVAAVAFESLVKLVAFLAAGIYITYSLFGGYSDIVQSVLEIPQYNHLIDIDYPSWFSLTMISFFAILLLPRQFHLMVVENSDETHIKKAMWLFPLYLLLINLFVPAIAGAGLLLNTPGLQDMFIISIPLANGHVLLALLVFIGGASAATAMVIVDSVAVSTMMLNELEMPHLMRFIGKGKDLPTLLLTMKRLNILLVVGLAYLYSRVVQYQSLVDIGLVSFLAASQMAPAALGGLYWKKGTREGAIVGLIAGFVLWIYTALIPSLTKVGWLASDLVNSGPFGISLLRPTALFGLELDVWSHSAFWSLLINALLYVLVSLMSRPTPEEVALAEGFVDVYQKRKERLPEGRRAIRVGTLAELEATLARYVGEVKARSVLDADLASLNATRETVDARQLLKLWDRMERTLTGSVGPSAARLIVEEKVEVQPVLEEARATEPKYSLRPGRVYLVLEKGYEVFTDQITHGIEGLCITYKDPDEVRKSWMFTETPIIRLVHRKACPGRCISPTNLPLLFITIKAFVESSKNSVILLDSLEGLVQENAGVVPDEEMLDFVNQLERLAAGSRTRLVLPARPEFVHRPMTSEVNPSDNLIFSLGPMPSYLLRTFISSIISSASETSRGDLVREVNRLLEAGDLFGRFKGELDEGASCDPDMRISESPDRQGIKVDPGLRISRRDFFTVLRRLVKAIKLVDPELNPLLVIDDLIAKYGFSRFEYYLTPGMTYVIEEDKPRRSMEIFSELTHLGMDGLCISRYNPESLLERYDIDPQGVIWLTQRGEGPYRSVDPTNFPRLSSMISDFLSRAKDPLILLEGLGYLITQSNYETLLRFIQSQRDDIALKGAILLVHIDPLSLDTKELHRLESEMETLDVGTDEDQELPGKT